MALNQNELRARLRELSPLPLIRIPSPLEPLTRLKRQLDNPQNPNLWIKRDDELGPGLGGNKGRMLTYVMADVLAKKKRKVATYGGLQSNHARMTAAVCASLGLETHLFYFEKRPKRFAGNLLLNKLLGAKMHFIPIGSGASSSLSIEATIRMVHLITMLICGRSTYFIPGGGHSVIGSFGYVEAAVEVYDQLIECGLSPEETTIITPVGTGGTLAGLIAGFALLDAPVQVIGIDIGNLWHGFTSSIARLASAATLALGTQTKFEAKDIPMITDTYVGAGYAQTTEIGIKAIRQLAQLEGILLDPVYTGKAFAGMLDLIQKQYFSPGTNLIFLHTGGLPALLI